MKQDTATNKTDITKSSDKKSLKINLAYLERYITTASVETNYHIAYDEIDRIFDGKKIHCTEVKHYTSDDSEQLKE